MGSRPHGSPYRNAKRIYMHCRDLCCLHYIVAWHNYRSNSRVLDTARLNKDRKGISKVLIKSPGEKWSDGWGPFGGHLLGWKAQNEDAQHGVRITEKKVLLSRKGQKQNLRVEQTVVPKVIDELQALCALKGFFCLEIVTRCANLTYYMPLMRAILNSNDKSEGQISRAFLCTSKTARQMKTFLEHSFLDI